MKLRIKIIFENQDLLWENECVVKENNKNSQDLHAFSGDLVVDSGSLRVVPKIFINIITNIIILADVNTKKKKN